VSMIWLLLVGLQASLGLPLTPVNAGVP